MFNVIKICEDLGIIKTLYFIKIVVKITMILVPIIIIVRLMYVLLKSLFKNDEHQNKKLVKESIIKIIVGASMFFIPTIVNVFVGFVATPNNYFLCIDNANAEYIKFLTEIENKKFAEEIEKLQKRNEKINTIVSSNTPSTSTSNLEYKNLNDIYVGDSKTVGMYRAVVGQSSSGTVKKVYENNYWFAKWAQGYKWFKATAYPETEKKLKTENYNFYHLLGANDLKTQDRAKDYVNLLEQLAKKYPNSRFVVVSVTPIDDVKIKKKGYKVRNHEAIAFNEKYINAVKEKGLPNLVYCDIYSSIISSFETTDGLHYTKTTYKRVFSLLDNC